MVLTSTERHYVEHARIARLATTDENGRPNVVPVCFALIEEDIVVALDEKPKDRQLSDLRRVRDIKANPFVAVMIDHYDDDWARLGWVQMRGRAEIVKPSNSEHHRAIEELRMKYEPYADHALEERPIIRIRPGHAVSWGDIEL